jgi:predicted unusual protein kinase regulating ubiquinone biosynthesis (AarF/ABC1/UbiB family)
MQIGQFFAARAEFVPEPICRKLSLLHDQAGLHKSSPTHNLLKYIMHCMGYLHKLRHCTAMFDAL